MQDTQATTITSRAGEQARGGAWRSRSISSLIDESFSMYVSLDGM